MRPDTTTHRLPDSVAPATACSSIRIRDRCAPFPGGRQLADGLFITEQCCGRIPVGGGAKWRTLIHVNTTCEVDEVGLLPAVESSPPYVPGETWQQVT